MKQPRRRKPSVLLSSHNSVAKLRARQCSLDERYGPARWVPYYRSQVVRSSWRANRTGRTPPALPVDTDAARVDEESTGKGG